MSRFGSTSRRDFLRTGSLALAALGADSALPQVPLQLDPSTLKPYSDPLFIPPLASAIGQSPDPENRQARLPHYRIALRESQVRVHRDLPPTRMWTLGGSFPGITIETQSGHGVLVDWVNELPAHHFLPIDHTLEGAGRGVPEVRAVIHLHGGRTPPDSDGYPERWTVRGQTQTCHYPCNQAAALLFCHDHSMGINRLNIYAGMQAFFIVRDPREDHLGLPSASHEIPLMFADRLLTRDGQLLYPVSADPQRPWVPEVFGNAILVNGVLLPYHAVEPRPYRLRLMNGSNGRFYRISLAGTPEIQVIANDQGLLPAPVSARRVTLAPAERADVIVDFSRWAGSTIRLVSDSFELMEFRVAPASHAVPAVAAIPKALALTSPAEEPQEKDAVLTRRLTLDERLDLVQRSMGMLLNNTPWMAPVTEKPVLNTTEIWELVNLTDDSHPIHLHLVKFRILDRRRIDTFEYQSSGKFRFFGPPQPPEPFEAGWKDTARADPGSVTRILVPFHGYSGRYVWHCHILEHEDNEMMRPFEVLPPSTASL